MTGFIKLNRKSFAHKFWTKSRVFSEFEAWIDLIQSARFDETVQIEYIGGREIKYGRGQYPASRRFLAERWQWGEQKVRSFLNGLKKDGSITIDDTQGMSIITLCKYEKYNSTGEAENPANNPADNQGMELIMKELQELKTQLSTHQITQWQPSDNPKNKKEKKEKKEIKENILSAPVPDAAQKQDFLLTRKKRKLTGKRLETFLVFWEWFAYKKGKSEAADAWLDIPNLTNSICDEIYRAAGIEARRRPGIEASGKIPKMAQGWLTGRRWEDETYKELPHYANNQENTGRRKKDYTLTR